MGGEKIATIELTLGYFKMHIPHLNNNNKIGRVSVSSTVHRFTNSTQKNARYFHSSTNRILKAMAAHNLYISLGQKNSPDCSGLLARRGNLSYVPLVNVYHAQ